MKQSPESKMQIALLNEKFKEMKEDRVKSSKTFMWIGGMVFVIIMAVGGSAIQQTSAVEVIKEKVKEQKAEIEKLADYINGVDNDLQYQIDELDNKIE